MSSAQLISQLDRRLSWLRWRDTSETLYLFHCRQHTPDEPLISNMIQTSKASPIHFDCGASADKRFLRRNKNGTQIAFPLNACNSN